MSDTKKRRKKRKKKEEEIEKMPPCTSIHHSFNIDMRKLGNLHFVEDRKIVSAVGNTLWFFDIDKKEYTFVKGEADDGIGAICVFRDETTTLLAVGCIGRYPNVYVYEYPSMKILNVLKRGTETRYTALCFDQHGEKLATVGHRNDYLLTIWNWRLPKIILRCKAYGQEIFKVEFSPSLKGHLTTSGIGHIKFWKMATTFTGLKLKGFIGKFGKVDISDIVGYAQFPDGKVLSGSEQGHLILWEENLVKVIFVANEKQSCHNGMVTQVKILDEQPKRIMTTGMDGYIKFWNFEKIDTSEASDTSFVISLDALETIRVGEGVRIVNIVREKGIWVIQDENGGIWQMNEELKDKPKKISSGPESPTESSSVAEVGQSVRMTKPQKLISFLSGEVVDIETSFKSHLAVVGGEDGMVRLVKYTTKEVIYERKFNGGVSTIVWNPKEIDPSGTTVTVGFANGVVRVLRLGEKGFILLDAKKPHNFPIVSMGFNDPTKFIRGGEKKLLLFTASTDHSIFFFEYEMKESITPERGTDDSLTPLGFVKLSSKINDCKWIEKGGELKQQVSVQIEELAHYHNINDPAMQLNFDIYDGQGLLVSLQDGRVVLLDTPNFRNINTDKTYELGNEINNLRNKILLSRRRSKKKLSSSASGSSKKKKDRQESSADSDDESSSLLTGTGSVGKKGPTSTTLINEEKILATPCSSSEEVSLVKYQMIQHVRPPKREKCKKPKKDEFGEAMKDETDAIIYETDEEAEAEEVEKERERLESICAVGASVVMGGESGSSLYVSTEKERGFFRFSGMKWQKRRKVRRKGEKSTPVTPATPASPKSPDELAIDEKKKKEESEEEDDDSIYESEGRKEDEELEFPFKLMSSEPCSCSTLTFSRDGTYIICGYSNGKIHLINVAGERDNNTVPLHISRIRKSVTSFDDSFLLSVGDDSCFFVQGIDSVPYDATREQETTFVPGMGLGGPEWQKLNSKWRLQRKRLLQKGKSKMPQEVPLGDDLGIDVMDSAAWSIEESRIKTEEQTARNKEERIKERRKDRIKELKKEYQKLSREMKGLLSRKELQLDRNITDRFKIELQKKLEVARLKKQWESEKVKMLRKKLEAHYLKKLDCERIVVFGFGEGGGEGGEEEKKGVATLGSDGILQVATFKCRKIRGELRREVRKLHGIIEQE